MASQEYVLNVLSGNQKNVKSDPGVSNKYLLERLKITQCDFGSPSAMF